MQLWVAENQVDRAGRSCPPPPQSERSKRAVMHRGDAQDGVYFATKLNNEDAKSIITSVALHLTTLSFGHAWHSGSCASTWAGFSLLGGAVNLRLFRPKVIGALICSHGFRYICRWPAAHCNLSRLILVAVTFCHYRIGTWSQNLSVEEYVHDVFFLVEQGSVDPPLAAMVRHWLAIALAFCWVCVRCCVCVFCGQHHLASCPEQLCSWNQGWSFQCVLNWQDLWCWSWLECCRVCVLSIDRIPWFVSIFRYEGFGNLDNVEFEICQGLCVAAITLLFLNYGKPVWDDRDRWNAWALILVVVVMVF